VSGTFNLALQALLVSVRGQLSVTPSGWPVNAREYVVPGTLAWDECQCGLLAIEWLSAPFSTAFPNPSPPTSDGCKPYLALQVQVTILRCAPNPGPHGEAPSVSDLSAAAVTNLDDLEAMLLGTGSAVRVLEENNAILNYSLGAPTPTGPQGGCVGVTQQVWLGFANRWGPC